MLYRQSPIQLLTCPSVEQLVDHDQCVTAKLNHRPVCVCLSVCLLAIYVCLGYNSWQCPALASQNSSSIFAIYRPKFTTLSTQVHMCGSDRHFPFVMFQRYLQSSHKVLKSHWNFEFLGCQRFWWKGLKFLTRIL